MHPVPGFHFIPSGLLFLALIHNDIANTHQRLNHYEQHLDRIEKRLALTDL